VIAIDSIQAVQDPDAPGGPGSVAQVRDGAQRLQRMAKDLGIATLLVGHVTKDGTLAGPRTLEHVVDTVLSFEGDRHHALRMLRALKHRFGPTDELGLMEMTGEGLVSVLDPSALFLADRRIGACGSVVAAVLEGTRPLCVEVQALVVDTPAPMPRRVAQAFDGGRLAMLVAILQQRAYIALAGQDIFASVAGGVKVAEPGADLAVALAIASARTDQAVAADTVVIGELGLGGEVRQVPQVARRVGEAQRLGFARAIVPMSTPDVPGIRLERVGDIEAARHAAGLH
jgi:DNA repair protein RadA/Sms